MEGKTTTKSLFGKAPGFSNVVRKDYTTTLGISVSIGLLLELVCCVLASMVVGGETFVGFPIGDLMWVVFGCLFFIRVTLTCGRLCMCNDVKDATGRQTAQVLCALCFIPFLFYMPALTDFLVEACEYTSDTKYFTDTLGSAAAQHANQNGTAVLDYSNETYDFFAIQCGTHPLPSLVISIVPLIGKVGIPLLFAYMVVKLSNDLWRMKLKDDHTRNMLMMTLLDVVDSSTFPTMVYSPATFVFIRTHTGWFNVVMWVYCIGYFTSIFEVIIIAQTFELIERCVSAAAEKGKRSYAFITMMFIDVPFMVVRCYFIFIGLEVSYAMLAKNGLAVLYRLPIVIMGDDNNLASQAVAKLVSLLPGAEKVDIQGKEDAVLELQDRLEEEQRLRFEDRSTYQAQLQAQLDKAAQAGVANSYQASQLQKMIDEQRQEMEKQKQAIDQGKIEKLKNMGMRDHKFTDKDDPLIADVFRISDHDKDGTLSKRELAELCSKLEIFGDKVTESDKEFLEFYKHVTNAGASKFTVDAFKKLLKDDQFEVEHSDDDDDDDDHDDDDDGDSHERSEHDELLAE